MHSGRSEAGASAVEHVLVIACVALLGLGAWASLGAAARLKVECAASAVGSGALAPCGGQGGGAPVVATADDERAPAGEPVRDAAEAGAEAEAGAMPRVIAARTLTDAQRALVGEALARLPDGALAALAAQRTAIVITTDSVASVYPDLRGARPRGAPPGATFEDVAGVFDPSKNRVVVALDAGAARFAGGDPDVLAHEIGHALDLPRAISHDRAFVEAYRRTELARGRDDYYLQPGRAGLEETFADSFADFVRAPGQMRARWGDALFDYWRDGRAFSAASARDMLAAARDDATLRPFALGHFDPIGAIEHHVSRAVNGAASAMRGGARAMWRGLPSGTQRDARFFAGFGVGVAQSGLSLARFALEYAPITPGRQERLVSGVVRAARHPGATWSALRAMPRAMVRYYGGLVDDMRSRDPYRAGRASGLLAADAALTFLPGSRIATATQRGIAAAARRATGRLARSEARSFSKPAVARGFCFAAGTQVHLGAGETAPIESLRVGARVRTLATSATGSARTDVEPSSWRRVRLAMVDRGDVIEIELLRPVSWIAQVGAAPGATMSLVLEEMRVEGTAVVREIAPAPAIEDGPGYVVLSTIASTSDSLLALTFEGTDEVLEATASHPLYSIDRGDWVRAGDLRAGERLRSAGGPVRIAAIAPRRGAHRVYNLEVETEHSFLVSSLGVLSHNNHPCAARGADPLRAPDRVSSAWDSGDLRNVMIEPSMRVIDEGRVWRGTVQADTLSHIQHVRLPPGRKIVVTSEASHVSGGGRILLSIDRRSTRLSKRQLESLADGLARAPELVGLVGGEAVSWGWARRTVRIRVGADGLPETVAVGKWDEIATRADVAALEARGELSRTRR